MKYWSRSCEVGVDRWWTPDVGLIVAGHSSSQCHKCCCSVGVLLLSGITW